MLADTRGSIAVTVAISLVVLLGFLALTLDLGQALVAKNELQDAADAAALAGARYLGVLYAGGPDGNPPPMSLEEQQNFILSDPSPIHATVEAVATQNQARGVPVSIPPSDILIGDWDGTTRTFTVTPVTPNAVQVRARRDPTANGPLITYVAGILGIDSLSVTASATAALTGVSSSHPGDLETPFGVSEFRFSDPAFCSAPVRFYPTNDPLSCGGWHTFTESPPNAATLRNIINDLTAGTYESPATQAGDTQFEFVGGNIATALDDLYDLYRARRDPVTGYWDALLPVYQSADCSNPNTTLTIIGYTSFRITDVQAPPNGQIVEGTIQCNLVDGGRGGGGSFGTLGSIPGLVQ